MGNKDKTRDRDATSTDRDHSRDQEAARDTALAKTIAEAVAAALAKQKAEETQSITEAFTRQMEKAHAQYEKLFRESHAAALPATLKVTSSSDGFRVMDPFDWTMNKDVYQRWQLWSHKARLALDAIEGDTEKTKISYLHHWLNGAGIAKIEGWKNSKILISQANYDALEERDRVGKYSLDKIESYFSLCELVLTPRSNPLLSVEDLYLAKQGSMTSGEFHSHILKIVKRCQFPNQEAEEQAVRDAIFMGMNSSRARDKAINLMNEEGKQVTVEFLLNHLAVEDGNTQHKFLSQLNSNSSVNMIAYDRRQNRGKSNRAKQPNGRNGAQNKTRVQTSSSTAQLSRKPPGMEGKCMRCGKPEHQQGEKCAAKNAKCKECHKIGHFYKVCQSKKKTTRANLAQIAPQAEQDIYYNPQAKQDIHIDECGIRQPNPPMVNMLRIVNHIGTTSGSQGNHLKFPIDVDPRGSYKNHLIVRVDTGADVNCMNEKTFRRLFPKVKLSVCPHEIQNFGNSTTDISILGQFRTYLQFRGEKYLTTFIVTNADDCPNLLSHGATFRMGVLLPNYPEENVVKGETGTISNVFQILQDLHLKQYQETISSQPRASHTSTTDMACTTTQLTPLTTYSSTPASQNTGMATPITSMSESSTVSRTTMPADTTPSSRQPTSEVHQNSSCSGPPICCMHVHQPQSQACKPGEPPALRKGKIPHNGKTSMNRSPLAKQEISSQFSSCFEGIGRFPGDPCKFHLKPDHQPARHASKKQGIPEEVNEHADWVHSSIFVEKALEREPYYTHSTGETTTEFPGRVEHARHFPTHMEMCMDDHFTQTTEGTQQQYLQDISHAEFPSGMENTPSFPEKQFLQGKEKNMDTGTFTLGNIILNRHPVLSALTHPGRVQQNFQQLKMESSNMVALPCFNFNAEATTQMETSKKRLRADSIHNGKDIPVTSSRVTPVDPKDNIQLPARTSTHTLMSVHSQDSHSSKTD